MVNQPLNNRGDESAHKALVRRLAKEYPNYEINVLFEKSKSMFFLKNQQMKILSNNFLLKHRMCIISIFSYYN